MSRLAIALNPQINRKAKLKEAHRYLRRKAREMRITTKDPAYRFMLEVLEDRRPVDGTDDEYLEALRSYAKAGLRALQVGLGAEEDVAEKRAEIVSEGFLFRELDKQRRLVK